MPYQNIDATLSPEDIKVVKAAFDTILKKMPFLINLTVKERRATFKAGPDSVSFIQNALSAAQDHPGILPVNFNTAEFKNDVDLFAALTDIGTVAASVASEIDDTRLAVGGEAMQEGIQVYDYVKTAAKTARRASNPWPISWRNASRRRGYARNRSSRRNNGFGGGVTGVEDPRMGFRDCRLSDQHATESGKDSPLRVEDSTMGVGHAMPNTETIGKERKK